ncbi:polyprotein P2ab, partial [Xufa yellow dwarf virus]
LKRRRIVLEEAPRPSPDSWIEPITGPRFDPSYGVFAPVNVDGRIYNVILQPDYWPILNPAISRDVKECAIPASPIGSVGVGKEPQSLVFLQDTLGRSIGVGCRVQCGKSSVLLTAWHVLDAAKLSDIYLAKCNRRTGTPFRVKFERDWPVEYECAHEDIDISAVQVPDSVWSKLGVTAAKVGMPRANAPVTCFGGLCHEPASSVGRYAPEGLSGEHSCSTRSGWSGTPLYSAGKVVGVHIEWHKIGASNRATAVWPFHLQKESWSGDSDSGSEISDEEMDARSDVRSYVVKGRGRFRTAGREFSRTADYAPFDYEAADKAVVQRVKDFASREKWLNEEDEDDYGPVLKPSWFRKEASLPSGHLNLPRGVERVLGALCEIGGYQWCASRCLQEEGMPLFARGRSGVKFRESGRTVVGSAVRDAIQHFPTLSEFDWPERGTKAEIGSLLLQASRFRPTEAPSNLPQATAELVKEYPKIRQRSILQHREWDKEEVQKAISEIAQRQVNRDASPGVPLAILGTKNGVVLDQHHDLVVEAVWARLEALAQADLSPQQDPVSLVVNGLCDPVRLFVKQEPHPKRKLREGRFRLISSVSLIDQLVERVLFGYQNSLEIATWKTCPSKPGMGLSVPEQAKAIWEYAEYRHTRAPAAEADISGFDWSVQVWELMADVEMRIQLGDFSPKVERAARNRFICLANSVFQLSDGTLISQGLPGLMKSGSYCTSSSNSRIRCLMAKLIGSEWAMAMGDDSVEGWVENAKEKYLALGHTCKDYIACETEITRKGRKLRRFNFCSHEISSQGAFLTTWEKTLFRFLESDHESFDNLKFELSTSPKWPSILRYLCRAGLVPDKISQDGTTPSIVETSPETWPNSETGCGQGSFCDGCPSCDGPGSCRVN